MITVLMFLVIAALLVTLFHAATGKVPLWVAVLLLTLVEMLRILPLGR